MDTIALNKALQEEYQKTHGEQVFRKYIMSELLAPIADSGNAVALIRSRYSNMLDCELLIIGAYIITQFLSDQNEMLAMLNDMCTFLPKETQAIVMYLNALQIEKEDINYSLSPQYREYLRNSCKLCNCYVNPYYKLAEISSKDEQQLFYKRAKENIEYSYTTEEISALNVEHFLDPVQYIKEFIVGTNQNVMTERQADGSFVLP